MSVKVNRNIHLPNGTCWCDGVSQAGRCIHKHQHGGAAPGEYCDRPWSTLCQTQHGDLCFTSDHETQPDATAALDEHLRLDFHIPPGSGDSPTISPCSWTAS